MAEGTEGPIPVNSSNVESQEINRETAYRKATDIGGGIMLLDKEARLENYSHQLRSDLFPQEMLHAIRPVTSPEEIKQLTEEDIQGAKAASFGLALETARQISRGELTKTGKPRADIKWWETLLNIISDSRHIAQDLIDNSPSTYRQIALELAAREMGKSPAEINEKVSDDKLDLWVKEIYDESRGYIKQKVESLNGYLQQ